VPEQQFRAGRAQILRGLLDLPAIYRTTLFFDRYEQQARDNVARKLEAPGT
jgi:predicted metal-dependent HD superfamily phosphohydrolase